MDSFILHLWCQFHIALDMAWGNGLISDEEFERIHALIPDAVYSCSQECDNCPSK